MGEAKRRKQQLGEDYGQSERIVPWLPITTEQSAAFMRWTSRGAWAGIGLMVVLWATVRFIGPALGWWEVV
ncbi:MAG: DUF2839 domain-containing protein [Cyanobacteria bacterium P01_A01_bin.105]